MSDANSALTEALGNQPFPWQKRLLQLFLDQQVPRALDLPTGLGKTSVMAIWLVARALGAVTLPRRLVYIVDRRAVVDQATREAEGLRDWAARSSRAEALGLGKGGLPISTLRGQFVDNRQWQEDPAATAIIVGTVDMIGSRVMFEGYACSRKMRPYHAGLLGVDTLFVVDEAHLVPPFERLLEGVVGQPDLRAKGQAAEALVPAAKLLSLSATGRDHGEATFRLDPKSDYQNEIVRERLTAKKSATFTSLRKGEKLAQILAERAWQLAESQDAPVRVLVFANKRDDAEKARAALEALAKKDRGKKGVLPAAELFVGGRRICERTKAATTLRRLGFLAGAERPADHAFVFATSAGEVGVDLDADHMACDVVAWERMVQRLGRVNRRGKGAAEIVCVADPGAPFVEPVQVLVEGLPGVGDGKKDVGLQALTTLRDTRAEAVKSASTPEPLYPPLTRAVVDAWSMTSLVDHTGRPEVQPWLRGWLGEDPPQSSVVWRKILPPSSSPADVAVRGYFDAAPPHVSERVDVETYRVLSWLAARCGAYVKNASERLALEGETTPRLRGDDVVAWCLDATGTPLQPLLLRTLSSGLSPGDKKSLERLLGGRLLVVDARLGGLSSEGLLDPKADGLPMTGESGDPAWDEALRDGRHKAETAPVVPFRIALRTDPDAASETLWQERLRIPSKLSSTDEDVTEWLVVEKWKHDGATEDDRSTAARAQKLEEHHEWTATEALRVADRLRLPEPWRSALVVAARIHDEGKRADRWQRAFRAPKDAPYAKTLGPVNVAMLGGYRHELGSLLRMESVAPIGFAALPSEAQALVLHLVVSHHGYARPSIRTDGCDDAPPSVLGAKAGEIARRFAELQVTWGPWGLAWWETLLRAADQRASRRNDESAAEKRRAG